jgi:DNA-binding GntR family transcriptional regulator
MAKPKKTPMFTKSLVDQVYEHLLDQIISNKLYYGDNLNIKDISEELGISTMPVREAIKRLEYDKIVEVKPRSSCLIRTPDEAEIAQIYEVREGLEKLAVDLFLSHYDASRLKAIHKITQEMESVSSISNDVARSRKAMELDYAFHAELCHLSDNDYIIHYHRQLCLHLNMAAVHAKSFATLKEEYFHSHFEILKCLESRSSDAIKKLDTHFNNVWAILKGPGKDDLKRTTKS